MKRKRGLVILLSLFLFTLLLLPYGAIASPFPFDPIFTDGQTGKIDKNIPVPSAKQVVQVDTVTYPKNNLSVLGYYAEDWPGDKRAKNDLSSHINLMDTVAPFAYVVNENGNLEGTPTSGLSIARNNGVQAFALVHNYSNNHLDAQLIHKILQDPSLRHNLVQNVYNTLTANGFQGVQYDFEAVPANDRNNLTALLQETASLLHPKGYQVSIALPAKTTDSLQDTWAGAYDYKTIGKIADSVVIMVYDEHWLKGTAGPIASYPWAQQVTQFAVNNISPEKVYLGVAAYGYDWANTGSASLVQEKSFNQLAASNGVTLLWDEQVKESHFSYTKNGILHTVWSENAASLDYKIQLAMSYQLKGIAIWRLGYTDQAFWDVINSYNAKHPSQGKQR